MVTSLPTNTSNDVTANIPIHLYLDCFSYNLNTCSGIILDYFNNESVISGQFDLIENSIQIINIFSLSKKRLRVYVKFNEISLKSTREYLTFPAQNGPSMLYVVLVWLF